MADIIFLAIRETTGTDTGRDVKRGMAQSAKMGFYPAPVPIGYLDDKHGERGKKKKLKDPNCFPLIRKMFDLMLTGQHAPPRIVDIANKEWGFRGPNGKKLGRSTIYNIFTRTFYYGEFEFPVGSGNWHKGTHEPMITRQEYDRVQLLLGKRGTPRGKKRELAYRGPIKCGGCGAMITGEIKIKRQKNGNVHQYIYYHCTRRKDPNCKEPAIEEKELEKQIATALALIEIPEDFKDWALSRLKEMNTQEVSDRERIYGSQRREYEACVRKIDNLIDMRANNELTEEEFSTKKNTLQRDKERFQELLQDTDKRVDNWLEI